MVPKEYHHWIQAVEFTQKRTGYGDLRNARNNPFFVLIGVLRAPPRQPRTAQLINTAEFPRAHEV